MEMEIPSGDGGTIGAGIRRGLLAAILAATVWLGLYPDRFHGLDVHQFTASLARDHLHHANHLLYLRVAGPPAIALHDWLGFRLDQGLAIASALGAAIAVGATIWTAALLGLDRGTAIRAAALVATAPGVAWFANVPEVHGVFLGFAGLAFVAWAWFERSTTPGSGLLLGALTALAAGVHASGHLLVPLFGLLHLAQPRRVFAHARRAALGDRGESPRPPRRRWLANAAALTAWAALSGSLRAVLGATDADRPGIVAFALGWLGDGRTFAEIATVIANEWLLPFLPLAILAGASWIRRASRPFALATALATLGYLAVAAMLLQGDWSERGAYLLPLAIPYALLAAASLPHRLAWTGALVAALTALPRFGTADDTAAEDAWARDLTIALAEADAPAIVVTGVAAESDGIIRVAPELTFLPAYELLGAHAAEAAPGTPLTDWFITRATTIRAAGTRLWLTSSAIDVLAQVDPTFATTLSRRFRLRPVEHGGFQGVALGELPPRGR